MHRHRSTPTGDGAGYHRPSARQLARGGVTDHHLVVGSFGEVADERRPGGHLAETAEMAANCLERGADHPWQLFNRCDLADRKSRMVRLVN